MVAPIVTAMEMARTVPSICTFSTRGSRVGMDRKRRTSNDPSARPSAPPRNARTSDSVTNVAAMRIGLAPSDTRTAASDSRLRARTSRRQATLAHAMRRTRPTAPRSALSVGRT